MNRPNWDEYFIGLAESASTRAECTRRMVGAVVVQDGRVRGVGYNGALPGLPSCLTGACPRGLTTYKQTPAGGNYSNCIADHAERNALRNTYPEDVDDSIIYISQEPCEGCHTLMASAGVYKSVWPDGERTYRGD